MSSCGGNGACDSGCQPPENGTVKDSNDIHTTFNSLSVSSRAGGRPCPKCGAAAAAAGRESNGLCGACFRAHLFGKFKLCVSTNAMISPTDKVLVAVSGGAGSRVALEFIHEMQCKSLKYWDASNSQALPVFVVGVAFIDESVLSSNTPENESTVEAMRSVVSKLHPPHKELHVVPIENIFSLDPTDGKIRLNKLFESVSDATGKEDLLQFLRILLLQKTAVDHRYTKIVLGSCASTIACHVLSATVKGQGYSLPADIQYIDARWDVPVVLPMRDCLAEELSLLCHLEGLNTLQQIKRSSTSINGLISSFVTRLREENSSRERTILRTAEKLKAFSFNKFLDNSYHDFVPSRLRCKFKHVDNSELALAEVLCPMCRSPLSEPELNRSRSSLGESETQVDIFSAQCCLSCSFQILPKGGGSLDNFYTLLPEVVTQKAKDSATIARSVLREQIEDYLLHNDDDGINGTCS